MDKKEQQYVDPIKKQGYKNVAPGEEMSAMSPPDAYSPPADDKISYDDMHPFLQELMDEHKELTTEVELFEQAVKNLTKLGNFDEKNLAAINRFITYFNQEFIPHNKKEEHKLFPILAKRFIEVGESSPSKNPITGVDVLENEHIEAIQIATLAFNYYELSTRLRDEKSCKLVFKMANQKSVTLIELLKLHMFREDDIVFGRAMDLLTKEDMDGMLSN